MAALSSGSVLGPYEIVGPLGAGGMGEVYRARDTRLGREVAIKVLPRPVASSPDRLARFKREARTVAALNHPNIVVLHSIEEVAGICFITMELVDGRSLAALVGPGGLPLARVLEIATPLADALVAAHERGVVHRDLKPANVMVTRDGRIKVLDFGLAKLAESEREPCATQADTLESPPSDAGQIAGTVPYMAPEQLRREGVDARTDLFAFGILVYELATGRRPFTGPTLADVTSSILRDTPTPLTRARPDLPIGLERILDRCLQKNAHDRFQRALDVANELRAVRRTMEHGVQPRANPPTGEVASIAVLPFMNRSRDQEDEYFSDGLADELLNVLARIRGLRVAARSSAFAFKGKGATVAEVGKVLNVATVLEGSVRKSGNRVRISVELVKVSDGYNLWSETYDRMLDDIFAVQDDIARSVVKELRAALLGEEPDSKSSGEARAEVARAVKGRGQSAEAHRLYLRARHFLGRFTPADTAKGIRHLKDALELDPDFAFAWTELGRAYAFEAGQGWTPVEEGRRRAREAVERALALEPDLAEAHAVMESIQTYFDWDWSGAERSIRRALELAPGNSEVLRRAGAVAWTQGRSEEAIGLYQRAIEQDPLSSAAYHGLGRAYHSAGRFLEAEEASRKALELAPDRVSTRALLGCVLLDQGRAEEGLAEASQEPDESWRLFGRSLALHANGRFAESAATLEHYVAKYAESDAVQIAEVLAVRGEVDRAFDWLERARAARDGGLSGVKASPWLRPLHGDARWAAFLAELGFSTSPGLAAPPS